MNDKRALICIVSASVGERSFAALLSTSKLWQSGTEPDVRLTDCVP